MMYILGSTKRLAEFDTEAAINDMGGYAVVPREAELIRLPKQRRPQLVERPFIPGYVFTALTADQWHAVKRDTEISFNPVREITPIEWRVSVQPFVQYVDTFYQFCMEDIDRQMAEHQRMSDEEVRRKDAILSLPKINVGEVIKLLGGMFAEHDAIFQGVDDTGPTPMLKVRVQGVSMFGKPVDAKVDPVNIEQHAAE